MQFRRRAVSITVVLLLLVYAGALRALAPLTSTDNGSAEAQGYPPPTSTSENYPPPAFPTVALPPTNTLDHVTLTPAVRVTSSTGPTRAPSTREPTPRSTAIALIGSATPTATSTPGVTIVLPPTATRRVPTATEVPVEQQAIPSPTEPVIVTTTPPAATAATATPSEAGLPATQLLPPVADGGGGPGVVVTLLAGILLAGLAWWVWKRWLISA